MPRRKRCCSGTADHTPSKLSAYLCTALSTAARKASTSRISIRTGSTCDARGQRLVARIAGHARAVLLGGQQRQAVVFGLRDQRGRFLGA